MHAWKRFTWTKRGKGEEGWRKMEVEGVRERGRGRGRGEKREGRRGGCKGALEREIYYEDRINGIHYNTTPYITQYCSNELFFGWGHPKEHRYVDKDCPGNYQIIEVGAG